MDPLRIASVGECTVDDYVDLNRQFIGGISFNFAVNAKRSGAEHVSLFTRIGKDQEARVLQKLQQESIDFSHVAIGNGEIARQKIVLTPEGDRLFPQGGYDAGVLKDYMLGEKDVIFLQQHGVIVSALFKQVEALFYQVIHGIAFDGWLVADFLDLSDYDYDLRILQLNMDRLKIAFVSGNQETAERLQTLSSATDCLFVLTMGANGSMAFYHGESFFQPALLLDRVIDTTGAGDAFQAAFVVSYWRNQDPASALKSGAEQAAKVIQHLGAVS